MNYKPGDVENGHILGSDNQWHPITDIVAPPAAVSQAPAQRRPRYWQRYKTRWLRTALICAAITAAAPVYLSQTDPQRYGPLSVGDIVAGVITGLLLWGTPATLIVAAFPAKKTG